MLLLNGFPHWPQTWSVVALLSVWVFPLIDEAGDLDDFAVLSSIPPHLSLSRLVASDVPWFCSFVNDATVSDLRRGIWMRNSERGDVVIGCATTEVVDFLLCSSAVVTDAAAESDRRWLLVFPFNGGGGISDCRSGEVSSLNCCFFFAEPQGRPRGRFGDGVVSPFSTKTQPSWAGVVVGKNEFSAFTSCCCCRWVASTLTSCCCCCCLLRRFWPGCCCCCFSITAVVAVAGAAASVVLMLRAALLAFSLRLDGGLWVATRLLLPSRLELGNKMFLLKIIV